MSDVQDQVVSYTYRQSILTKPWTFTLNDTALVWQEEDKPARMIPFSSIIRLQPKFDPTRVQLNRHIMQVYTHNGQVIKIASMTYKGISDFADQAADYASFIHALHDKLATANPSVEFKKGITQLGYMASVGVLVFLILLLVIAVGFILTGTVNAIIVIKLLFLLYFIPTLIGYLRRNKPQVYDPRNLPESIVPRGV